MATNSTEVGPTCATMGCATNKNCQSDFRPHNNTVPRLTRRYGRHNPPQQVDRALARATGRAAMRAGARSSSAAITLLNRRTPNRAVGTKYAAVARLRAQHRLAVFALVEELARIRGHRCLRGCAAVRTS